MAKLYDVVVKNRHVEGENIAIIEFESASSTVLPKVEAGAHIDVYLPNGMVRQYSLCQNPAHIGIFRLGILRDPESRGGSVSAFDDLKEGMKIQVSEPKNLFPLVKAKHTVLIGGGLELHHSLPWLINWYSKKNLLNCIMRFKSGTLCLCE